MANLARWESLKVKHYANQLLSASSIRNHNFCIALDGWLRNNFRYRSEEKEIVRTPEFMLTDLETQGYAEGDCDDISTLACALCHAVNIPSRLTAIASNSDRELNHVFAECLTMDNWIPIDPTVEYGTVYQIFSAYHEPI